MKKEKIQADPFYQHRQALKGIFVATKTPESTAVIAKALDYRSLREKLDKMGLVDRPTAVRYLQPKEAICAY